MREGNGSTICLPEARLSLDEVLRQGAQRLLAQAIEAEVAQWIEEHQQATDDRGRWQVVRNGYLPERKLVTAVNPNDLHGHVAGFGIQHPARRLSSCKLGELPRKGPSCRLRLCAANRRLPIAARLQEFAFTVAYEKPVLPNVQRSLRSTKSRNSKPYSGEPTRFPKRVPMPETPAAANRGRSKHCSAGSPNIRIPPPRRPSRTCAR